MTPHNANPFGHPVSTNTIPLLMGHDYIKSASKYSNEIVSTFFCYCKWITTCDTSSLVLVTRHGFRIGHYIYWIYYTKLQIVITLTTAHAKSSQSATSLLGSCLRWSLQPQRHALFLHIGGWMRSRPWRPQWHFISHSKHTRTEFQYCNEATQHI
jgi:hypothetical protein